MTPHPDNPVVSIVVPTFRRPEHLDRCLASIEATVGQPHEVICVSVAGDDGTADVIALHGARHIEQDGRHGGVHAMNLGFQAARGAYVTQINDDCEVLPHSIDNALRFLQAPAHRNVGQAAFFHDTPVARNIHQQIDVEGVRYVVCHVRGLCFANFGMVRRDLGERLGWLDEQYFLYGADPDFSLKVWHEAGMRVEPCPGALVHHMELADERGAAERAEQHADNALLFAKWDLGEAARGEVAPAQA